MAKARRPIWKRILIWLFSTIMTFVLIIVGFCLYLYFAKGINTIDVIKDVKILNQQVNLNELAKNQWDNNDLESAKTKFDSVSTAESVYSFTDKEIAAYINDTIHKQEGGIKANIGSSEVNLIDYGFEVLQMEFNIPNDTSTIWTSFNTTVKVELEKLKKEQLGKFPLSLIAKILPNTLYISSNLKINKADNTYGYTTESLYLTINNLSDAQTNEIFKTLNTFISLGDVDVFNKNIGDSFVNVLLGDNGIYDQLKPHGATDYSFRKDASNNYFEIYTVDTTEEKHINYNLPTGMTTTNPTTYHITDGTITLNDLSANGYEFHGWYTEPNGAGDKITTIDTSTMQDYNLYPHLTKITYNITYEYNGGTATNPTTYDIETETFTLNNPTKEDNTFLGWTGTGIEGISSTVTIEKGSYGHKSFIARYDGDTQNVTLVVNNSTITTYPVTSGITISTSDLSTKLSESSNNLNGYSVKKWYTNPACTSEYNHSDAVLSNLTLYGKWEYLLGNIHFYPYLTKFNTALSTGTLNITSHEELIAYIDFVRFYDITTQVNFTLAYLTPQNTDAYSTEITSVYNELISREKFETDSAFVRGAGSTGGNVYGVFYVGESNWSNYATNVISVSTQITVGGHTAGTSGVSTYTQQDYALKLNDVNTRATDYDDFKINSLGYNIPVSTSGQLVWVLENGYNPVCEPGSSAETMYNEIKKILRKTCDNSMSDVEKLRRIYEWLVINVKYDNSALKLHENLQAIVNAETNPTTKAELNDQINRKLKEYDSWYIEGVINNKKAVCEGFAKTLLVMARLENIPAIYITGDGHAWNKVWLDGNWYGIDATHGNVSIESSQEEILSYDSFLFTDANKAERHYHAENYDDIDATEVYSYYDNVELNYNSTDFDLLIDNAEELELLLNLTKSYTINLADATLYTIEFALRAADHSLFLTWLTTAASNVGVSYSGYTDFGRDSSGNYIYTVIFN